jgi:hypothetical protein
MLTSYKLYFGLILSKLYNSKATTPLKRFKLISKKESLLWNLDLKGIGDEQKSKTGKITIRNCGSKMNNLLLEICITGKIPP